MTTVASYFAIKQNDDTIVAQRRSVLLDWFISTYPEKEFSKDDALYYCYLKYVNEYESKINDKSLEAFLKVELRTVVLKKEIRVTGASGLDYSNIIQQDKGVQLAKEALCSFVEVIRNTEADVENFVHDLDIWINSQLESKILELYTEGMTVVQSVQEKKTGPRDALEYTAERIIELEELYSRDKLAELQNISSEEEKFKFLFNTGIEPLDNVITGIYSSELISIEAPPGVGKTKFALCQLIWRAVVIFKVNCAFLSLEQRKIELESLLIARHYHYLFQTVFDERNYRIKENYAKLPQEVKVKVETARDDLFNSGQYGKLALFSEELRVDTIINKLKRVDKLLGGIQVFCIDYIGLVMGALNAYRRDQDFIVIKDTLVAIKGYCRKEDKAVIAVNQLGAGGAEKAEKGQAGTASGAQGGMIVYRSSDKNFILSATKEQKIQKKRKLEVSKSRGSEDVFEMILGTKLCMGAFFPDQS